VAEDDYHNKLGFIADQKDDTGFKHGVIKAKKIIEENGPPLLSGIFIIVSKTTILLFSFLFVFNSKTQTKFHKKNYSKLEVLSLRLNL
jgi:hypothetical protein